MALPLGLRVAFHLHFHDQIFNVRKKSIIIGCMYEALLCKGWEERPQCLGIHGRPIWYPTILRRWSTGKDSCRVTLSEKVSKHHCRCGSKSN